MIDEWRRQWERSDCRREAFLSHRQKLPRRVFPWQVHRRSSNHRSLAPFLRRASLSFTSRSLLWSSRFAFVLASLRSTRFLQTVLRWFHVSYSRYKLESYSFLLSCVTISTWSLLPFNSIFRWLISVQIQMLVFLLIWVFCLSSSHS